MEYNKLNNINSLLYFVKSRFQRVMRPLKAYGVHDNDLFDTDRISKYGKFEQSYVGHMCCGKVCYILGNLMLDYDREIKLKSWRKAIGYSKHIEDHVYLTTDAEDQEIIIDPTYRQFL